MEGKVRIPAPEEPDRTITLTARECRRIAYAIQNEMGGIVERMNPYFTDYIEKDFKELQMRMNILSKLAVPLSEGMIGRAITRAREQDE